MRYFSKIINKIQYLYAVSSSKRFEHFLVKKGCSLGKGIWWCCDLKTIEIDFTRPLLIEIGDNVMFNKNITLLTHDAITHVFRNKYNDFIPSSGLIKIGNNVYIGRQCTILKNVKIGNNCIIAYGSIVTKDIPDNSVAAGIPAKVICTIDEYYNKRKEKSLEEAFEYAKRIKKVHGRKPTINEMYEEFPFYLDGDKKDPGFKLSVEYQTRGFNDYWKKSHKAPYKDFDDFLKAAGIE